jgi:hypothetical protein
LIEKIVRAWSGQAPQSATELASSVIRVPASGELAFMTVPRIELGDRFFQPEAGLEPVSCNDPIIPVLLAMSSKKQEKLKTISGWAACFGRFPRPGVDDNTTSVLLVLGW